MKPPEDLLAKVEELVVEKELRIANLTNWIEILESKGYEAQAAGSRELLALLQQNLALSRDNIRLMQEARAREAVFLWLQRVPSPTSFLDKSS